MSVRIVASTLALVVGAQEEPLIGTSTASAGEAVDVTCHQGAGTGEITSTSHVFAVQVG